MGLHYSIKVYIKKEKLYDAFNWLEQNSDSNSKSCLAFGNNRCILNSDITEVDDNPIQEKAIDVYGLSSMSFNTSLVFDIDSVLLRSFEPHNYSYDYEMYISHLDKQFLGPNLLPGARIRVGGFDCWLRKLGVDNYELDFTASATDTSLAITKSFIVRKWIGELSEACSADLALVDEEFQKRKIIYYAGRKLNIDINMELDRDDKKAMENFFNDYFDLTFT
jgi:hypothetical protein